MAAKVLVLALLSPLVHAAPSGPADRLHKRVTINASVKNLGFTTSNYANIYRDGGGGGTVNGLHLMMFSDGIVTSDGKAPTGDLTNWKNFTSNSIAVSGYQGAAITALTDFGTTDKGPKQQVPYFYNNGESDGKTAVWPTQNMVTLCSGGCAVSFPEVLNRTAISAGASSASLYNTPALIQVGAYGPVVTRPVQSLFRAGEPLFGTFSAFLGIDGYLYAFAKITGTKTSNGLKMARVPSGSYADRSQYQYWNGNAWSTTIPAYDDGGVANVFKFSRAFGTGIYGPGTGELFYSQLYGAYVLMFQADDAAIDGSVYVSYSTSLTGGWSTPVSIYTLPVNTGGYSYAFHAYPNYDSTGRSIPISWTQYNGPATYQIAMANVTFS